MRSIPECRLGTSLPRCSPQSADPKPSGLQVIIYMGRLLLSPPRQPSGRLLGLGQQVSRETPLVSPSADQALGPAKMSWGLLLSPMLKQGDPPNLSVEGASPAPLCYFTAQPMPYSQAPAARARNLSFTLFAHRRGCLCSWWACSALVAISLGLGSQT